MVWSLVMLLSCIKLVAGVHFSIIGDWGDDEPTGIEMQKMVASYMADWCAARGCDFVFSMGDNFYPDGVTSPTDPRFDSSWKEVYDQPSLADLTWYISIGNHDHDGNGGELNQVLYGLSEPRWVFPDRWYDFVVQDPAGFSVHFVTIDSQSLRLGINDPPAQLQWLDETLAASTSEWRVVITHHPPYSAGNYGPTDPVIDTEVVPILKRNKVHLVLSGHDHNLQHIQNATNPNDVNYFISGGGGRACYDVESDNVDVLIERGFAVGYFGFFNGFSYLEFTATEATVTHLDFDGTIVYEYTRGVSTEPPR